MRVCVISREFPPDTGFGGIATFANHLAHGLKELGHDVEVVSLAKGKAKSVIQDGIKVHRVDEDGITWGTALLATFIPYSRYVIGAATALWQKFLELHSQEPFDVVDCPELLAEGLIPAVTRAVPLLIRLYTPHSKFIAERFHNVTPSFDHQFVAMLERVAMLTGDVLTSPSEDLSQFVARDLNYPLSEIEIVRNPVDADMFSPVGGKALAADPRLTVLFVGRLEERKGIGYLIDAIPEVVRVFPQVRFVIVGDDTKNGPGQKSVLHELKARLKAYGLEDHTQFIDRVSLSELPGYYRSADICVVPSVYDNSPYTCMEAMACGKPVIGTSAGGTREYMVDQESGVIIEPRDSRAIAGAILGLLKDENERERLGANARKRVLERFQKKEIARQTVELYQKACRNFAAGHRQKLYLKDSHQVLADADEFLRAFDRMFYDELYRQSIRFRIDHWFKLIKARPRLAAGKIILSACQGVLKCLGSGEHGRPYPAWMVRLEEEITVKAALRRPTYCPPCPTTKLSQQELAAK